MVLKGPKNEVQFGLKLNLYDNGHTNCQFVSCNSACDQVRIDVQCIQRVCVIKFKFTYSVYKELM